MIKYFNNIDFFCDTSRRRHHFVTRITLTPERRERRISKHNLRRKFPDVTDDVE